MKKSDIAMIIFVASISVVASYFIINALPIFKDETKTVKVKTMDPINPELTPVDPKVFNKDAVNPTVEVIIGEGN